MMTPRITIHLSAPVGPISRSHLRLESGL